MLALLRLAQTRAGSYVLMAVIAFLLVDDGRLRMKVEHMGGELLSQKERTITLLKTREVELRNQISEAEAREQHAVEEARQFAEMVESERARTAEAEATLAIARRNLATARTAVDEMAKTLEWETQRAEDVCAQTPVPPDYNRARIELYDAAYFGGYGGGSFDFDAPEADRPEPGVEDDAADVPARNPPGP